MKIEELKGEIVHLDDEFGLSFQDINGLAFCHCQVAVWSPSMAKKIRSKIAQLQRQHCRDAYGVAEKNDLKHQKWLTLMGFERFKNKWILDEDGNDQIVSIYVRKYK